MKLINIDKSIYYFGTKSAGYGQGALTSYNRRKIALGYNVPGLFASICVEPLKKMASNGQAHPQTQNASPHILCG